MSSIGETLASERRRKGKTVAEVAAATRIRGRLIEALENDRWEDLPNAAYVKGYIQSYASYLDIPAGPLLHEYRQEQRLAEEAGAERGHPYLTEPVVPAREQAHAIPVRSWAFVAAVFVVAVLAVWGIARLVGGSPGPAPLPRAGIEEPTGTVEPPGAGVTETPPGVTPTTTTPPSSEESPSVATASDPFELTVRTKGEASWLRIVVDGKRRYEGILEEGGTRTYTVEASATVRAGKPSAVTVLRDGDEVGLRSLGNIGAVDLTAVPVP